MHNPKDDNDAPAPGFGPRVRASMLIAGVRTASELARRVGVPIATAHRWCNQDTAKGIDAVRMIRLAVALRCSGRWLIWGRGSPSPMETLTPDEAALVDAYRRLAQGERRAINGMIQAYLAPHNDASGGRS